MTVVPVVADLVAAVATVVLLAVAVWLVVSRRRFRRADWVRVVCRQCRYEIIAHTATCPECGADLERRGVLSAGSPAPRQWISRLVVLMLVGTCLPAVVLQLAYRYTPMHYSASLVVRLTTADASGVQQPVARITSSLPVQGWTPTTQGTDGITLEDAYVELLATDATDADGAATRDGAPRLPVVDDDGWIPDAVAFIRTHRPDLDERAEALAMAVRDTVVRGDAALDALATNPLGATSKSNTVTGEARGGGTEMTNRRVWTFGPPRGGGTDPAIRPALSARTTVARRIVPVGPIVTALIVIPCAIALGATVLRLPGAWPKPISARFRADATAR